MEVVSLRRLDSQKHTAAKKKSIFYLVPRMIIAGVILSVLVIVAIIKLENQPVSRSKSAVSANPAVPDSSSLKYVAKGPLRAETQAINPERISPDSNDMAIFLANSFLENLPDQTPDCKAVDCVALTFDDGPQRNSTPVILSALEQNYAHASFFEIGSYVGGNEALLRRMSQDGDDIGNHSWSHPSFLKLSAEEIKKQVSRTQKAIQASGVPAPHLFRPPYGDFLLSMQKDINLAVILWNVDPKDWAYNDPAKIAEIVKKQIRPGAIVVMHDKPATAKAVDIILRDLKTKYRFVTVSELLNLKPGTKGAYVGR
ncbi:MAG: polysaccharide deacetylase family protein [Candidatus Saccharimonadales bacterium]